MRQDWDLYGQIVQMIRDEVKYMLHYIGKVVDVNDSMSRGRVKVMIEELGFDTPNMAIWCWPRQGNSMSLPRIGQSAEVYFLGGDSSRPVYLFPCAEIIGNIPKKFSGNSREHVLFEDPNDATGYVKYDSNQGILDILSKLKVDKIQGKVTMLEGTESFVKGDTLSNWILYTLVTWINAHTHPSDGAAPTPPLLVGPSGFLSTSIKGS